MGASDEVRFSVGHGLYAVVDAEDALDVMNYKWCVKFEKGVAQAVVRGAWKDGKTKIVRLHRFLLKPKSEETVDHVNGDVLDNRRGNLRICTLAQNSMNKNNTKRGISGRRGVTWDAGTRKWRASISIKHKTKYLGIYDTIEQAHAAYREAAQRIYGEFAAVETRQ